MSEQAPGAGCERVEPDGDTNEVVDERSRAVRAVEAEFGELANRFRIYIKRIAENVSPGLAPGTYKVFSTIERRGPITLSTLAEHIIADKASISRAVGELEKLGLIDRTPDPNDGRSQLLTATELGTARLLAARTPDENRLIGELTAWSVDDIERLATLLHALNSGIAPDVSDARRQ